MRQLIPHGKEHLFSIQQIWDAHRHTFDSLGFVLDDKGLERLKDMFRLYVDGLKAGGRKGVALPDFEWRPIAAAFSPSNGWPAF